MTEEAPRSSCHEKVAKGSSTPLAIEVCTMGP